MPTFKKIISEDSSGIVSVTSKLGVGTSSPTQTVDIRGQFVIDDWIRGWEVPSNHTYGRYWMNFNSGNPIYRNGADNKYHKFQRYSDEDVMVVGGTDKRVGIGTSSPTEKLHISGNIKVASGYTYYDAYKGPRTTSEYLDITSTRGFRFNDHGAGVKFQVDGTLNKISLGSSSLNMNTESYGHLYLSLGESSKISFPGGGTHEIYRNGYYLKYQANLGHQFSSSGNNSFSGSEGTVSILHNSTNHKIETTMSDFKYIAGSGTGGFGFRTVGSDYEYLAIKSFKTGADQGLIFQTRTHSTSTHTERMRLDSSGRLMIGTTTASGTLTVDPDENASTTFGKAKFYSAVTDYMYLSHFDHASSTAFAVKQAPNGSTDINSITSVGITISNQRKLTVNSSGNVGIGTNSPSVKLDVDGDITSSGIIRAEGTSGLILGPELGTSTTRFGVFGHGNGGIAGGDGNLYFAPRNASSGNGSYIILGQRASTDNKGSVRITAGSNGVNEQVGDIILTSGAGTKFHMDGDTGNVGIGTVSPSQKFHIKDSANTTTPDLFSVRSTGTEVRIGIGKSSGDSAIDFSTSLPNGGGTISNIFRNNFINNVRTGSHNGRLVLQSNNGIRIAGYGDNPSGNTYGLEVKNTRNGTDDAVLNVMKYDNTNILRVESQGYIGVNEDNPLASLHINKVGSISPIIFNDGYYGYALGGGNMPSDVDPNSNNFRMYMSSTRLHMVTSHGSGQFRWLNGGSNRRMTLDNSGNLAIGLNVDPSHKLDIQGSSTSGTIVQIRDTGDDYPVGITYNHGVAGHQTAWYAGTMDGGSGERKFTIGAKASNGFHNDLTTSSYSLMELSHMDSSVQFRSGKVWIGNTHNNGQTWSSMGSKGNELILDGGANSGLTIVTGSNEAGYITHNNYNNGDYQHINFDSENAGMFFKAGGTDNVLVLKSAGVGIGVASPSYKLDLLDGMRINRSSNDPYILFARGGTSVAQIRGVNGGGINITDGGSSNSRIYVNSSGNVGIGDTTPTTLLDVGGSFKVQGTADFQDTVSFEGDVDFTNSSIEGLPAITVSPTTIFKCATTATNINFGVSLTKGDILFGTPTTENSTYIGHVDNDEQITLKRAGEYEISVTLVVTAQSASNRFTCLTYVEHYNSSNTLLDSYGLEAMYIRSNGANYNSGAMAGQIRITTGSLNTWLKVTSMVLDRESTGTVPLNTTYSKIRIDKIEYNQ